MFDRNLEPGGGSLWVDVIGRGENVNWTGTNILVVMAEGDIV